jgi:Uma2 family endonuclease
MAQATPLPTDADDPAVQKLLDSPRLALYRDTFAQVLERERAARERFYDEIDASTKAEFINGEVVMSSPARVQHIAIKQRLEKLLDTYAAIHDLGEVLGEKALVSLTRNDYEPDVAFFGKEKAAGLTPEQWKLPAPDFACEILSPTTESNDRGVKFDDYAAHGVGEYWIVDPVAATVEQYVLDENEADAAVAAGRYDLRVKVNSGEVESAVVDGFRTPVAALFDDAANLEALRALLA